jgi:hypothetical protein
MGVGSNANGDSIMEPNGQAQYQDWEFLYDPRVELLRAKAALTGGLGSAGAGALGTGSNIGTPGATSPFGSPTGTTPGQTGTNPTQP